MKVRELKKFLEKIPDSAEVFKGAGEEDMVVEFWNSNYNSLEVVDLQFDRVTPIIILKKKELE